MDWELEEARRRGELPDLFNEPQELGADPTDSPRSQVQVGGASSSSGLPADGALRDHEHVTSLQPMWDDEGIWPQAARIDQAPGTLDDGCPSQASSSFALTAVPPTTGVADVQSVVAQIIPQELCAVPTDSPRSQVVDSFECRAVRMVFQDERGPADRSVADIPVSIGVPTNNPTAVFRTVAPVSTRSEAGSGTTVRKVDDSMYTENVEGILESLAEPLRVVYNVSPAEVRRFLDRWIPAARIEVDALVDMKAITRLLGSVATKAASAQDVQVLPAKTVFTVKPGSGGPLFRRKCRVVGCGNFESREQGLDLYASGVPADVLRSCLVEAATRNYDLFVTDVKNAFLRADIPESVKGKILLRPPRILELMNITKPGELWAIEKAVYGLRQSPKWWANYRDNKLAAGSWTGPSGTTHLEQSAVEPNLWKLKSEDNRTLGLAIIYVDDVMLITSRPEAEAAYSWIRSLWECTALEAAAPDHPVTFLGVEIHVVYDSRGCCGFALSQEAYIQELARSYDIQQMTRHSPLPKEWVKDQPDAEEGYSVELLRKAQKITGELLWLTQRTRIDLAYSVALMGSWCSKAPEYVQRMGLRILEFLSCTKKFRLSLVPHIAEGNRVAVYSDASFAPYGNHSVTGVVINFKGCPIIWKSKRQALVALSTAESELIAACEAVTVALSAEALIADIAQALDVMHLMVDNTAAISLAEGSGTQRTRHLRVRSNFIRDMLVKGELRISHCPGDVQLADALTKVLPGPRHATLNSLLGLGLETLNSRIAKVIQDVAFVQARPSPDASTNLLVLTLVLQALEGVNAQEENSDPVSLDLYVMLLLMTFSILFIWESCKYCARACSRNYEPGDIQVNMIREDDSNRERRTKRQEAVRRAIEREAGELRHRGESRKDQEETRFPLERDVPVTTLDVSVNLHSNARSERASSSSSIPEFVQGIQPTGSSSGPSHYHFHGDTLRAPLVGTSTSSTRHEVGTQTEFYQGLTYQQMCDVNLLTTSGRSASAVHLFPNCQALRNTTSVQNRSFCRYCILSARQGL